MISRLAERGTGMAAEAEVTSISACNTSDTTYHEPHYMHTFRYIYYVIYVLGFVGNLFALVVWALTRLRFSPVAYFRAICVADSLVLLMHPLESLHAVHLTLACQAVHMLFLAVQVLAIFLVLGLSVERFIDLVYPLQAQRLLSYAKTKRRIACVVGLSLVVSSGELYIWHVDDELGRCRLRHTVTHRVMLAYTVLVLLVLFLLPLLAVLVLNGLIHYKLRHRRRASAAFSAAMVPDKLTLNKSVAVMACYLALWEITYAVVHTYGYVTTASAEEQEAAEVHPCAAEVVEDASGGKRDGGPLTGRWHSYHLDSLPLLVLDVLALTSYAVDVVIYTVLSNSFRGKAKELCRLVLKFCKQRPLHHPPSPPVYAINGHSLQPNGRGACTEEEEEEECRV